MPKKIVKPILVRVEIEKEKNLREIQKRTGETNSELFERLISSEYKRITNGESIPDSLNNNIEMFSKTLNEIVPIINEMSKTANSTREGANRIYCGVLFVLKELLRTMHFISGAFSNSSLLKKEQLSIISNNADQESSDTFSTAFKFLSDSQPKEIVEMLKNK